MQMRTRAEQAERQRDEALTQNRELREQLAALHDNLQHSAGSSSAVDQAEVMALRQELDRLSIEAAAAKKELQRRLEEFSQDNTAGRNVELEAELQAAHQEAAVLRQAVREKDKLLEELNAQYRNLEDNLEDRDREMDRLRQDMDHSPMDSGFTDNIASSVLGVDSVAPDSEPLYTYQEKASSQFYDEPSFGAPSGRKPRRIVLLAAGGVLLVGVVAVTAVFLFFNRGAWLPEGGAEGTATSQPPAAASQSTGGEPQPRPATAMVNGAEAAPSASAGTAVLQDKLRDGSRGPLLTDVPSGSFVMGNKRGLLNKDEQPAHEVELKSFSIGVYEVTFAQYDAFARATGRRLPSDYGWGRGERPVVDVTWDDALAYTQWLSQQTEKNYRLPTEAEWEYAARAGTNSRYWWGINADKGKAVCFDCGTQWDGRSTAPVGSLTPNPFGLYDTSGNAMEWVEDCYNQNYNGAPGDGSAWLSGNCTKRMVRGGAFNKPSSSLRNSARYQLPQESHFNMLGFRVVRE